MKLLQEFKEFALRGNVVDMAVGIIVGAAFGKIVSSLVNDVVMPPLALLTGGADFADKKLLLKQAVLGEDGKLVTPDVTLNYGLFLNTVIDFMIVAFAIFLAIKVMNALRRQAAEQPAAPAEPPADVQLLSEIRDLLKAPRG